MVQHFLPRGQNGHFSKGFDLPGKRGEIGHSGVEQDDDRLALLEGGAGQGGYGCRNVPAESAYTLEKGAIGNRGGWGHGDEQGLQVR